MWLVTLSRRIHDCIYSDKSQSLCSRAWHHQDTSTFWRCFTFVFGRNHCRKSHDRYWND